MTICPGSPPSLGCMAGTVGLTKADLICVPAMIAFGLTRTTDQKGKMTKLFCQVDFSKDEAGAAGEIESMSMLDKGESEAMVLAPLKKGLVEPDTVAIYGNPAQIMRLVQAWVLSGRKARPRQFRWKSGVYRVPYCSIQNGHASRRHSRKRGIGFFSMTQDDEMVFALPGNALESLVMGLKSAGKKIGARYPITFYQNFQPEFSSFVQNARRRGGSLLGACCVTPKGYLIVARWCLLLTLWDLGSAPRRLTCYAF